VCNAGLRCVALCGCGGVRAQPGFMRQRVQPYTVRCGTDVSGRNASARVVFGRGHHRACKHLHGRAFFCARPGGWHTPAGQPFNPLTSCLRGLVLLGMVRHLHAHRMRADERTLAARATPPTCSTHRTHCTRLTCRKDDGGGISGVLSALDFAAPRSASDAEILYQVGLLGRSARQAWSACAHCRSASCAQRTHPFHPRTHALADQGPLEGGQVQDDQGRVRVSEAGLPASNQPQAAHYNACKCPC